LTLIVIDASVLASAAAAHPDSPSARLFTAVLDGPVELAACPLLITELERALRRRYFAARISVERRAVFCDAVAERAAIHADPVNPPPLLRDPSDDYIVALARSAGAEAIVTGDRDLLDHAGLEPAAITPRAACERFGLL
jgi:putative PIN family toxin of toxin-antitoxin system